MANSLIEKLCRALAFHVVEIELTFQIMEPQPPEYAEKIAEAKALIAEAGYDLDVLYPVADRPVVAEANN